MHHFATWELGYGINLDISAVLSIFVSCVIVFILARLATRNLSVTNPSKMQNFMEWVVDFIRNMVSSTMNLKKGQVYVSLGMTLIMFIFVSNILGLPMVVTTDHEKPVTWLGREVVSQHAIDDAHEKGEHAVHISWWKSPTADLSVTAGLALTVTGIMHFRGMTRNRKHYFKHFLEPYPVFLPLNLLEIITKPLTLALRLFANIYAGEVLISTILMASWFGIPLMAVWQGFSVFVGGIQAFLFTILTMVYISQYAVHDDIH